MSPILSTEEALERLKAGNRRYVDGISEGGPIADPVRRSELVGRQDPFAIVLGCSDSRVPSELVFDQGLGDLFVIRVAGNIVAPSQIGSVEFAAKWFGTRLVVVLGHSQCGAVWATLDELKGKVSYQSANLRSIIDRIRPSVEPLLERDPEPGWDELLSEGVRANIRSATDQLRHGSAVLEERLQRGELLIVGAEYCLESGLVEFLEDPSGSP